MGQSPSSVCTPNTSSISTSGRRRSFRSPFARRKKHKQLSATFQAPNYNGFESLNINLATVEQFMTLPGINRRIAQTIVDHRHAIGGRFQRIDDLALVSGIGAAKLEQIRPEITIKRPNARSQNGSSLSSRTPSLDSVFTESVTASCPPTRQVYNVNTSSVFQLQQINGMNQELAANLVEYRTRKGPFKSLDDLIKVKGLSQSRLGAIRSSLSCNDNEIPRTPKFSHGGSTSMLTCPTSTPIKNGTPFQRTNSVGHRKSISMPIPTLANGFANVPVNDIYDLLGAYSHRPTVEDNYNNTRNGHSTIRLASWNLHRMCTEKASNLGVREVICRTILENRLSIVCAQELISPLALHAICDELNRPRLRRIIEWKANTRNWKYLVNSTCAAGKLSGLGFIYDADRCDVVPDQCFDISLKNCIGSDETYRLPPSAYVASFRMTDWTCHVLNTYLRYFDLAQVQDVIQTVEDHLKKHTENIERSLTIDEIFLVVGDFTGTTTDADSDRLLQNKNTAPNRRKESNHKSTDTPIVNLESIGFHSICPPNDTSSTCDSDSTEPSTKKATASVKPLIASSCNILCRDQMPPISTRSAFREALYRTKSPFNICDDLPQPDEEPKNALPIRLCGYHGVVRQGLCHMAIPRGFAWGGAASEHCPVWVELYKQLDRTTVHQLTGSVATINDTSSVSGVSLDARAKRQLFHQRRNSLKSNGSYTRMMNVMNLSAPAATTNGDLNLSSDSVFVNGI